MQAVENPLVERPVVATARAGVLADRQCLQKELRDLEEKISSISAKYCDSNAQADEVSTSTDLLLYALAFGTTLRPQHA